MEGGWWGICGRQEEERRRMGDVRGATPKKKEGGYDGGFKAREATP
jgi:hypothetical protein